MSWNTALGVRPGVTAVIGGGGKTTLLRTLGGELAAAGNRVLLCTTTKIHPFPGLENLLSPADADLEEALERQRLVCAGTPVPGTQKLTAPAIPMARLAELADYVLVEADGSAQRPLKAHAPHEPVIPAEAGRTVCVVGASGFGRAIREAAHRPERFAELAGLSVDADASPEAVASVLRAEALADIVYVNQTETPERLAQARTLADLLEQPVLAGSLQKGEMISCWW